MILSELTHQALVQECARSSDSAIWAEFLSRFHQLISLVVLRTARRYGDQSADVVEDLVQDTYLKLCRDGAQALSGFQHHHPDAIFAFLKVFATNVVHDYFKGQLAEKRSSARTTSLEEALATTEASDPSRQIMVREVYDSLMRLAKDRDRRIFLLHYRLGFTAESIARIPSIGLSSKGVESTLSRLTKLVREDLQLEPP